MNSSEQYYNKVKVLVSVFTVDKGILKVLLVRKKVDPYKGYWILPGDFVSCEDTLEERILDVIDDTLGLQDIYIEQCHTFSNLIRNHDERVIAVSYFGLVDGITLDLKRIPNLEIETSWFSIDDIPKMAYDHEQILSNNISMLRYKVDDYGVMEKLFPKEFTLTDYQNVYEQILDESFDRRNFRKKIASLDFLEETGNFDNTRSGRPARLFRFKEDIRG